MGQAGPADPAAAEHPIAVIEHRRLARRDRPAGGSRRAQPPRRLSRGRALPLPAFASNETWRHRHTLGRRRAEPIQLSERNSSFGQGGTRTDDHLPPFGLNSKNVKRFGGGDPEPLALADREMDDAVMPTKYPAVLVDDVARLAASRAAAAATRDAYDPCGTKQMSWLSGLSATGSPKSPRQCCGSRPWRARPMGTAGSRARRALWRTGNSSGRGRRRGPDAVRARRTGNAAGIMPGGERRRAEIARRSSRSRNFTR